MTDGKGAFEVTCVEAANFPGLADVEVLARYAATHSHEHDERKGSDARTALYAAIQ